jgi:hypothetical protein
VNADPQHLWEGAFAQQEEVPLPILCVTIASFPGMFPPKAPSLALRHEVLLFYLIRRGEQINEEADGVSCVSCTACVAAAGAPSTLVRRSDFTALLIWFLGDNDGMPVFNKVSHQGTC